MISAKYDIDQVLYQPNIISAKYDITYGYTTNIQYLHNSF